MQVIIEILRVDCESYHIKGKNEYVDSILARRILLYLTTLLFSFP
jgi:hypothetical protein